MSEIKWEYAKNKEPFESVVDKSVAADLLEALQKIIEDLRMRAVMMGGVDEDGSVALDVSHSILMKADAAIARALGKNDGEE